MPRGVYKRKPKKTGTEIPLDTIPDHPTTKGRRSARGRTSPETLQILAKVLDILSRVV